MIIKQYEILQRATWAILVQTPAGKFWLPKSHIQLRPNGLHVPTWLARAKGIIRDAT